jgi:hypothetical protein
MPNLIPIIELLLGGEGCEIEHVFLWGAKKCEQTKVPRPLNPKWPSMLKNMDRVFNEISPKLNRPFFCMNTLFINECPYKCMGNVPYSYILLEPFNIEVDDKNYLLGTL